MENQKETENSSLGSYLKRLRHNKKLTLRETERLSGISNSYISQLESNKRTPTIKTLIILAATYDVPSKQVVEQARQFIKKMKREAQGNSRIEAAKP